LPIAHKHFQNKTGKETRLAEVQSDSLESINHKILFNRPGDMALLEIENLATAFPTEAGMARAVDDVTLSVDKGQVLGIVGESGCGKSITSLSILRLIPPPGKIVGGQIRLDGQNLLDLSEAQMRNVRGNRIALIPQDPMTSLNPVYTVGAQIMEAVELHQKVSRAGAQKGHRCTRSSPYS